MADKKPTIVEKNSATVDADEEKKKKNQEKEKKWSKMIKFKKYIYRVLKQVHPDIGISSKAVKIINTIITNIMVKIIHQSSKYINLRRGKSKMLTVREIPAAVMEVFPPQMAQLAISAAHKAQTTYKVNQLTDIMDRTMSLK